MLKAKKAKMTNTKTLKSQWPQMLTMIYIMDFKNLTV